MMKKLLSNVIFFFFFIPYSQNTIGIISNSSDSFNGYTLFTLSTRVFLIDNCGQVINEWTSTYPPGNAVYLLEDGSILRAGRTDSDIITMGGAGGVIEKYDWDGNLTWQFFYDSSTQRQHHDIYPMPNGNVLILAATIMTSDEAIQAGRNPAMLNGNALYNEQIIEVTPVGSSGATIVWEWNIKDHLIQDFDSTKDNFGNVAENPNKLDINFTFDGDDTANWLHINSIQYDETLDQIVLSSRNLSEVFIIDHSTSTAQAATGSGGIYGKGGDLLYRWGNPQSYRQGSEADRKLYGQHFPHFIRNSSSDNGKIILFNNGRGRSPSFSEVFVIDPPMDSPGFYTYTSGTSYGPSLPEYVYTDPDPLNFFSSIISGAQRLPNGNTLIMEGTKGRIFEIDSDDNVVWEYFIPVSSTTGTQMAQGTDPTSFQNSSFRALRYALGYSAFNGRDLTAGLPLETNPDINTCLSILSNDGFDESYVSIYPNPTSDVININTSSVIDMIEVYTLAGGKVLERGNTKNINLQSLETGVYFIRVYSEGNTVIKKIIKQN